MPASTPFGIEEEFVLLDPTTLAPVDLGTDAVHALHELPDAAAATPDGAAGKVTHEFYRSQLEHASPVCHSFAEAFASLHGFRERLSDVGTAEGALPVGTGTPPRLSPGAELVPGDRYARIAADIGALTDEHLVNGLHVHVAVPDRDVGVQASNSLRRWLPLLVALSADSPLWEGRDTSFDSWRSIHLRRWTTSGIPPHFADGAAYDRAVSALAGVGATSDEATINWSVRLSPVYPTIEIRAFDAQLDAFGSVTLAVLTRALVQAGLAGTSRERVDIGWGDAAVWHAARHGVSADLVDPWSGVLVPAAVALQELHEHVLPHLQDEDERDAVAHLLGEAAQGRTGATAQREAHREGPEALAALYRDRLTAPLP